MKPQSPGAGAAPGRVPAPEKARPSPSASASAPAGPPPDPSSLQAHGGAVGYWLDSAGKLRRLETLLKIGLPTNIELVREDRAEFATIDALGGGPLAPVAVSKAEATALARLRQRDLQARGGQITITMPVLPGGLRTAQGWLDWQRRVVYLSVRDADVPDGNRLVYADAFATHTRKSGGKRAPAMPPLPAPRGDWKHVGWETLNGSPAITDLDYLLYEALTLATERPDDAEHIARNSRRLRVDVLHGVPVGVFEMPSVFDGGAPPGGARLRYWMDNGGVLRRLELRTATGGLAQLDVDLANRPPTLPAQVR